MNRCGNWSMIFWVLLCFIPVNGEGPPGSMLSAVDRGIVPSPDGEWVLTVWGERDETPWLMLQKREVKPKYRVQVWPINNAVYVLWAPDSKAFAFTDARFENDHFLFVDHLKGYLQSEVLDLTPALKPRFLHSLPKGQEILRWYVRPLLWPGKGTLVVGVNCDTAETKVSPSGYEPVRSWFRAYLVDVEQGKVILDLDDAQTKKKYGISLENEKW